MNSQDSERRYYYNGSSFASVLEVQWAVFFDFLGVPWKYEPKRYYLGELSYLPDFWLPRHRCFIEIKGHLPLDPYADRYWEAARHFGVAGYDVVLLHGNPWPRRYEAYCVLGESWMPADSARWASCFECSRHHLVGTPVRGVEELPHLAWNQDCRCSSAKKWVFLGGYPKQHADQLSRAYLAAGSVRSEHCEAPGLLDRVAAPLSSPAVPPESGFAVGCFVKTATYGEGRITSLEGVGESRQVKIRFFACGEKTFVLAKALAAGSLAAVEN